MKITGIALNAIVTHSIFVVLNVAIVATNIFLPRILDRANLKISDQQLLIDIEEVSVDPSLLRTLEGFFGQFQEYSMPVYAPACETDVQTGNFSPECAKPFFEQIAWSKDRLDQDIENLERVHFLLGEGDYTSVEQIRSDPSTSTFVKRMIAQLSMFIEMAKAASDEEPIEDQSRQLQALFETFGVRNGADADSVKSMTSAAMRSTIDGVDSVASVLRQLAGTEIPSEPAASGDFVVRVLLENSGFADAFIAGGASLSVNSVSIPMVSVSLSEASGATRSRGFFDRDRIVAKKSIVEKYYAPDLSVSASEALESVSFMIKQGHSLTVSMSIEANGKLVSQELNPKLIKLSLENTLHQ